MADDPARNAQVPLFVEPSSTPFEPATEVEAAAFGRALLAEMRGEPLTPAQHTLLDTARSEAPADQRAPSPIVDFDQPLLSLDRGRRGEVRIGVRRYRGSVPFLDIRRWERTPDGLRPTRQGVTIRARELTPLLGALTRAGRFLTGEAG